MQASTTFPRDMPKEEHEYCYGLLTRSNHIKSMRATEIVDEVVSTTPKPDNAYVKNHGVNFFPLLEGCVQFGKLGGIHKTMPKKISS